MEIREINIKEDDGHVADIIQQNLEVIMAARKAEKEANICADGCCQIGFKEEGF